MSASSPNSSKSVDAANTIWVTQSVHPPGQGMSAASSEISEDGNGFAAAGMIAEISGPPLERSLAVRLYGPPAFSESPREAPWLKDWIELKRTEKSGDATRFVLSSIPILVLPKTRLLIINDRSFPQNSDPQNNLEEGLAGSPVMQEIRIRYPDGDFVHGIKSEGQVYFEADRDSPYYEPSFEVEAYKPDEIQVMDLKWRQAFWEGFYENPHAPAENGRLPKGSLATVLKGAIKRWGASHYLDAFSFEDATRAEKPSYKWSRLRPFLGTRDKILDLGQLRKFADLFAIDLRELVAAANRQFKALSTDDWMTPLYPVYIDHQADVNKLLYYKEQDPTHESFGWLIFSTRKNPLNPLSLKDLGEIESLSCEDYVNDLEYNRKVPDRTTLVALSHALGLPLPLLIKAVNHTFYKNRRIAAQTLPPPVRRILEEEFNDRTVWDLVEGLFPGLEVYINPSVGSTDLDKILSYARNPGTLGQWAFLARKSRPEPTDVTEMGAWVGSPFTNWKDLEANQTKVNRSNLCDYIWLFKKLGLPLDKLALIVSPPVPLDSPAFLLAEALGRKMMKDVFGTAGVSVDVAEKILASEGDVDVKPSTIEALKEALPDLDAARFFKLIFPGTVAYLPELAQGNGLALDASEKRDLLSLDPPYDLFEWRLVEGLEIAEASRRIGVGHSAWAVYETTKVSYQADVSVRNLLVEVLASKHRGGQEAAARARKLIFLYLFPEALTLFAPDAEEAESRQSLKDAILKRKSDLSTEGLHEALMSLISRALREYPRPGVGLPATKKEAVRALRILSSNQIDEKLAVRCFEPETVLTVPELSLLKGYLPELDIHRWYEVTRRTSLTYFLGKTVDGAIDWSLPTDWSWDQINDAGKMFALMEGAAVRLYGNRKEAAQATGLSFLKGANTLQAHLESDAISVLNMAKVAKGLNLDRRLLYFFYRRKELQTVLSHERPQRTLTPKRRRRALESYGPGGERNRPVQSLMGGVTGAAPFGTPSVLMGKV